VFGNLRYSNSNSNSNDTQTHNKQARKLAEIEFLGGILVIRDDPKERLVMIDD